MNTDQYQKKVCRYSEEPLPEPFLELGTMALANSYVKPEDGDKEEFKCPLSLVFAPESKLVQLSHVVPPDLMFSHYLYVSSTTKTFRDHFSLYAQSVKAKLEGVDKPLAVDIGSNDGLLLSCYMNEAMRAIGIDPAKNLSDEANAKGLRTLNRYFDKDCVESILKDEGPAHAISGNNVFAHINDIHDVLRNVNILLHDDGFFVIEFPYLVTMVENMLFDMIYHEHLSYIGVHSLSFVLAKFDLKIFHIDAVSSHGGSLRVFIQKKSGSRAESPIVSELLRKEEKGGYLEKEVYERFAGEVIQIKEGFSALVKDLRSMGKRIAGYGAPAKASTILNFYGLGTAELDYVVDDNPLKQGYLVPGAGIPIEPSSSLEEKPVDIVIIFAWNFAKEILKKLEPLRQKGVKFLVPLTKPELVRASGSSSFEITAS